jgi:putative PIN family toxin of toxin-antitoxin system
MRVVIDTNVLISSFIGRGSSHKVLEHCVRNHHVVISQFILDELREKLTGKFKYAPELADEAVELLKSRNGDRHAIAIIIPNLS